jgi:hypothetical protein
MVALVKAIPSGPHYELPANGRNSHAGQCNNRLHIVVAIDCYSCDARCELAPSKHEQKTSGEDL